MKTSSGQTTFLVLFLGILFLGSLVITNLFIAPILYLPDVYIQISGYAILAAFCLAGFYAIYLKHRKNISPGQSTANNPQKTLSGVQQISGFFVRWLVYLIGFVAGLAALFLLFRLNLSFY